MCMLLLFTVKMVISAVLISILRGIFFPKAKPIECMVLCLHLTLPVELSFLNVRVDLYAPYPP